MVRTKGARDKKRRKIRSDRKKKYVRKYGKFVPYIPKKNKFDPIKLWFWEIKPMSLDGYHRFNKDVRQKIRKVIYKPTLRVDVYPEEIGTKDLVEELALKHVWTGNWLIMGFSHGKNKFHIKPVKLCSVKITEHPDGMKCRMVENHRMFRYWWWRG